MSSPSPYGGPVSTALEAELRSRIAERDLVIWLDADDHYSPFVDRLLALPQGEAPPYKVRAYRGSHLELMLSLEGLASGTDRPKLLIHLPGFNEESVKQTPHFALYAAGTRYRKGLDTLITEAAAGRVPPERIAAFLEDRSVDLEAADRWLHELLLERSGGAAGELASLGPAAFLDTLLQGGDEAKHLATLPPELLRERLAAWVGLPHTWESFALADRSLGPSEKPTPAKLAFVMASWILCVEYVDERRHAATPGSAHLPERLHEAGALPKPIIEACRQLAAHLRSRHPGFYRSAADQTEGLFPEEVADTKAADLGKIDTFRFQEQKMLEEALEALDEGRYAAAEGWVRSRVGDQERARSFWLEHDIPRRSAWQLVGAAARLGLRIAKAGPHLASKGGLEGALQLYREHGAAVDQAHRHLEQRRSEYLGADLPNYERLRLSLDGLRTTWREWADAWAKDFNELCSEEGFLPPPALQQRTLFDDVVRPLTREPGGTVAYFVVDALRYEMGEQLFRSLGALPSTTVRLDARLAELPTITRVGMNLLAPVARDGDLQIEVVRERGEILGFSTGEYRVHERQTRQRTMQARVGGDACPWISLRDVLSRDEVALRNTFTKANLLVVHSQEIDEAGESGAGLGTFDRVLRDLKTAWARLREVGIRHFVITADHGFLLHDDRSAPVRYGRKADPDRRHTISYVAEDAQGTVRVPFKALGYASGDAHLLLPETTAVFQTTRPAGSFVHGGNSLQERVIPVLTILHRSGTGGTSQRYSIRAETKEQVAGLHCVEITVESAHQGELSFGGPRELELAMRVRGTSDAQVSILQARGSARHDADSGSVTAVIGEPFELFFRLRGTHAGREQVELYHPGTAAAVEPGGPQERFDVEAVGLKPAVSTAERASNASAVTAADRTPGSPARAPAGAASPASSSWLNDLPAEARPVFAHLAAHGTVTEEEALQLLGGGRALRRFTLRFEEYVRIAPFHVRIDSVAGIKRYVRER